MSLVSLVAYNYHELTGKTMSIVLHNKSDMRLVNFNYIFKFVPWVLWAPLILVYDFLNDDFCLDESISIHKQFYPTRYMKCNSILVEDDGVLYYQPVGWFSKLTTNGIVNVIKGNRTVAQSHGRLFFKSNITNNYVDKIRTELVGIYEYENLADKRLIERLIRTTLSYNNRQSQSFNHIDISNGDLINDKNLVLIVRGKLLKVDLTINDFIRLCKPTYCFYNKFKGVMYIDTVTEPLVHLTYGKSVSTYVETLISKMRYHEDDDIPTDFIHVFPKDENNVSEPFYPAFELEKHDIKIDNIPLKIPIFDSLPRHIEEVVSKNDNEGCLSDAQKQDMYNIMRQSVVERFKMHAEELGAEVDFKAVDVFASNDNSEDKLHKEGSLIVEIKDDSADEALKNELNVLLKYNKK